MENEIITAATPTSGHEYWQPIIKQYEHSGIKSKREFCRQSNVHYDNFLYWLRKLTKQPDKKSGLIPVSLGSSLAGHCVLDLAGGHRLTLQSKDALACLPELLSSLTVK
ncbi:IS66 family insertion sequence element accessory protein TnpA [Piscirickettsia salmonis]|uniref:IS66 family insertion sequence element accessory protein TnpA n=1 Tax=Piscirickettsia salmonis TaxID=1238 RepID=UPI003EBD7602